MSQSGGYFRLESDSVQHTGDSLATLTLAVSSAFDYETVPSASWVTCTRDGQTLRLAVESNRTGAPRRADISLSCPTMGKAFRVSLLQYSVDDLMGSWTASYTTNNGQPQTAQVTLTHNAADSTVSLSGLDQNYESITLKADADKQQFSFATGMFIGFLERGSTTYRIYQQRRNRHTRRCALPRPAPCTTAACSPSPTKESKCWHSSPTPPSPTERPWRASPSWPT